MPIISLFKPNRATQFKASISDQVQATEENVLALRNPWVADSIFMGKLYTSMTACTFIFTYPYLYDPTINFSLPGAHIVAILLTAGPFIFTPLLAYRIFLIRRLSNIYLNRRTRKVFYQRFNSLLSFDWDRIEGALFARREFGGTSFSTSHALAFGLPSLDGRLYQKDCLWIDSNEPTSCNIKHVAEVWEYLRHFMDHGPDNLPPPGEPNWWHRPLHAICLTPAEAWRHYAPWRTGEPGEMQGKKNWQLPFWAVLFPYNFSLAVIWYLLCRTFNVRAAPPPPEAFEEAPIKPSKRKRP